MLLNEPIFHCMPHAGNKTFMADCSEQVDRAETYSILSMFATLIFFALLVDLVVFSTRVSAFTLVCARMQQEVGLFLIALFVVILAFACAIATLDHDAPDFAGAPQGSFALLRMA